MKVARDRVKAYGRIAAKGGEVPAWMSPREAKAVAELAKGGPGIRRRGKEASGGLGGTLGQGGRHRGGGWRWITCDLRRRRG